MLQFNLQKLLDNDELNTNFHYNYSLLKDDALRGLKIHNKIHEHAKNYLEMKDLKNKINLNNKKKTFNELEFKIFKILKIKDSAAEIQEQINIIKDSQSTVEKKIKEVTQYNDMLLIDRNIFM